MISIITISSLQVSDYHNVHHHCNHDLDPYDDDQYYDDNQHDDQSDAGGQKDSVATTKSLHVTNLLIDRGPSRSYR